MRGHPRIPRLRTVLRGQPMKNNENNESPNRSGVLARSCGISPRRRARAQLHELRRRYVERMRLSYMFSFVCPLQNVM